MASPSSTIQCPRCKRVIEYAGQPPAFCGACGKQLGKPQTGTHPPVQPASDGDKTKGAGGTRRDSDQGHTPAPQRPTPTVAGGGPLATLGGYRLTRLLGEGGMGQVFEGEDVNSGRKVAVKLIRMQSATNAVSLQRFRQEGRLASQIAHPRCVFVMRADEENGQPFIVMELMPGTTLQNLVKDRGPRPPEEAVRLILDVIEGLQEAHRLGVIHRDVKPSNCFLMPDGRVKVGDFGLAKSLQNEQNLTVTGAFLGTVLYAAPEQIRAERIDFAADVYAVTATLYFLLTGKAPFEKDGKEMPAVLSEIITKDLPPPPRSRKPDIPSALERVVLKGLHGQKAKRYQTLDELKSALLMQLPGAFPAGSPPVRFAGYAVDEAVTMGTAALLAFVLLGRKEPWVFPALWAGLDLTYFALTDGLFGGSLGKKLFGLRLAEFGTTDPPGLPRVLVRTAVYGAFVACGAAAAYFLLRDGAGGLVWAALPVVGAAALAGPMFASPQARGLHSIASGTSVLRLPAGFTRKPIPKPARDRIDALPSRGGPWPATVGPYHVRGVSDLPHGEKVLAASDPVLGRRVLLWLRPIEAGKVPPPVTETNRPTRLRHLGSGAMAVSATAYRWEAFVAPDGFPLVDAVAPGAALGWVEAQPILSELTEELTAARNDGTLPHHLTLEQVWVQSNGRVQFLEFPVGAATAVNASAAAPGTDPKTARCITLIAQAAAAALEGVPRAAGDVSPVKASVPRAAARFLEQLVSQKKPFGDLAAIHQAMNETNDATGMYQPVR